jgi:hypothetical protein
MAQRGTLEVIDKGGWRKVFPLNKNIVHIGSDARNDIVIEAWHGSGLAARHLQMVPSSTSTLGYRLVNMGDQELALGNSGDRSLAPRAAMDLSDGDIIHLGDLTLIFHGGNGVEPAIPAGALVAGAAAGAAMATAGKDRPGQLPALPPAAAAVAVAAVQRGNPIGLQLVLDRTDLTPERPVEGLIIIKNQGDKTGVQFKIEVDGFEPDSYDLGPAPILFPNVEKQIPFRLRHPKKPRPPAGDQRLTVRISAPASYPGEVATASQVVQVAPYLKHSLTLEIAP